MKPKDVVLGFYSSDVANDEDLISKFFHKDFKLHWHSSVGYNKLDFHAFKKIFEEIRKTYLHIRFEISHILQDNDEVVIRYTSYVNTLENPEEELPLAHFTSIWKVDNDKIIGGYQMSNLADNKIESLKTFLK